MVTSLSALSSSFRRYCCDT